MSLTNKLNGMTIKEGNDINTYLMEAKDMKNQLKAFDKKIVDKTLINTILNRLPQNYKMVIQGHIYMIQSMFKDIINELFETHHMAIREQKLE